MVKESRPEDPLQNLHKGNSDYRLDSLPTDESQPFEWYNNGKKNMWLPADGYSQRRYIAKGFHMGQIDIEPEPEPTEFQLTFELN